MTDDIEATALKLSADIATLRGGTQCYKFSAEEIDEMRQDVTEVGRIRARERATAKQKISA
jgi:hypothetical protein